MSKSESEAVDYQALKALLAMFTADAVIISFEVGRAELSTH
jgi:hypothetical protein